MQAKQYFEKLKARVRNHEKIMNVVSTQMGGANQVYKFYGGKLNFSDVSADLTEFIKKAQRINSCDRVCILALLNWASPPVTSSKMATIQSQLIGQLLNEQEDQRPTLSPPN